MYLLISKKKKSEYTKTHKTIILVKWIKRKKERESRNRYTRINNLCHKKYLI